MMRNIDKLVLFLINNDDKVTLSKSTATDLETVDKFCDFMINKILPEDFLIQEGSHIEEKDLNTLVTNFNSLLKEENLKPVLLEAINKLDIRPNQATLLTSNIMPILHNKIKVLMANTSKPKQEMKKEKVVNKKKFSFMIKKKEEKNTTKENTEEKMVEATNQEPTKASNIEKIIMAVVGVLLLVVVGVLVFFLIKVNL